MHPSATQANLAGSEDELLALQNEFLVKKVPPSAKVIRTSRPDSTGLKLAGEGSAEPLVKPLAGMSILEDVREHDPKALPKAVSAVKKKSIFALQREAARGDGILGSAEISQAVDPSAEIVKPEEGLPQFQPSSESALDSGRDKLLDEISEENERKVTRMPSEENAESGGATAQKEGGPTPDAVPHSSTISLLEDLSEVSRSEKEYNGLVETYKWGEINLPPSEQEKLQWTRDDGPAPASTNALRFNFDGLALTEDLDLPAHLGLHHHGMDPQKPGYTLEELFMLSRSSVSGQRVIALNTFANIFRNLREGLLSAGEGAAVRRAFSDSLGAQHLRLNLDSKLPLVIMAAIKALHAWLVGPELYLPHNEVPNPEERILSALACFGNGRRAVSSARLTSSLLSEAEAGDDAFHGKLSAYDTLAGFVAMRTFSRFRYLLELAPLPHIYHVYVVEILLRLARHSVWACSEICKDPELFDAIFKRYFQSTWPPIPVPRGDPIAKLAPLPCPVAVRFLTAISQGGLQFAKQLLATKLFKGLNKYLEADVELLPLPLQPLGIQMQAEILLLGRGFASYNLLDDFIALLPAVLTLDPLPGPSQVVYYRWMEALAMHRAARDQTGLHEGWESLGSSFTAACQLLSRGVPRKAKEMSLFSAALDYVRVYCTLKGESEVRQTLDVVPIGLELDAMLGQVVSESNKALASLSSLRPACAGLWDHGFRRFVPILAPPQQLTLLEELTEFLPRVSLLLSILKLKCTYRTGVYAKLYRSIHRLLCQLLGAVGCLQRQCWPLLSLVFDLVYAWLQLEVPPNAGTGLGDARCAVAAWYICASETGVRLEASLLKELGLFFAEEPEFVVTFGTFPEGLGLLEDVVRVSSGQAFWMLQALDLVDASQLTFALQCVTRIYSLFASDAISHDMLRAIPN
ncbi:RNA polymerase II associated protein 1 [Massospora cicadina]|nr:RNA polymerase II associated protein 1 [Massospora cicadina]